MGRFEWVILFAVFVGLLVWELVRVRRDIRRARAQDAADSPSPPSPRPPH